MTTHSSSLAVGIAGIGGRMGQAIAAIIQDSPALTLGFGSSRGDDPALLFAKSDVVIDFTTPEATLAHARLAASTGKPMVIGTTGLTDAQKADIKSLSSTAAIVLAPNTSVGVTVLLALAEQAARVLKDDYDHEIFEIHHRRKVDAPSGTALALGEAVARGAGHAWPSSKLDARDGMTGPRPDGGVGFGVLRGGDVVGEHTVYFFGADERVELTHRATDRRLFARGAVRAAQWAADQKPGLYGMRDVLGL